MSLGPVEELVVRFPGNQFKGEIIPALHQLVDTGIIRILDIAFVHKDMNGNVTVHELDELPEGEYTEFDSLVGTITGYFSKEDFAELARHLDNDSSAAFMLFENAWATRFRDAVLRARGEIVVLERIPKSVIDELVAEVALPPEIPPTDSAAPTP